MRSLSLILLALCATVARADDPKVDTDSVVKACDALVAKVPWEPQSKPYEKAKTLIKQAKELTAAADTSEVDKVRLRAVRVTLHLAMAYANMRKGGFKANRVSEFQLGVVVKDLGVLAHLATKDRETHAAIWPRLVGDCAKIAKTYEAEHAKAKSKAKTLLEQARKLFDKLPKIDPPPEPK